MRGFPTTTQPGSPSPRRAVARVAVGLLAAVASVVVLLLFFAFLALRIPWDVPDRGALAGPTTVLDRDGEELARFTAQVDRRVVSLDDVSTAAQAAVVASEDARFYEHTGVDPVSLLRAVVTNVRTGGISQGGSTLTQQYVKNAYLSPEQTLTRKVREAVISIALERQMSKDEILESYLNEVYFGELAWGIEAAALTYFGIPASELDAGQGATLAQLLPAPSTRNPRVDPEGARQRRDRVLDTMAELGTISPATARAEQAEPLGLAPPPDREPDQDLSVFTEYVRRQLVAAYGEEEVLTGALSVTTTVDRDAQAALEAAVADHLPADAAGPVEAAAVALDPATGEILALHPGRGYGPDSAIDLATQYRPIAGSTFKPFVYLTALEQGMVPSDVYPAPASVQPDDCPPAPDGTNPFRAPVANAGGTGYGQLSLDDALANSVNTVFVQLGCDVGPRAIVDTADRLGVRTPIEPAPLVSLGNPPLGPTVLDMASAFGTLANDGVHCPAHAILEVRDRDGRAVDRPDEVVLALETETVPRRHPDEALASRPGALATRDTEDCYGVADADMVRATTQALTRVVAETTGTRADIGRPQAGKTGTADDETFAWFAGYTPDLALVVQVSDPLRDPERVAEGAVRQPMRDVAGFSRVQGGTIPALIWRSAASAILADVPPTGFPEPGQLVGEGSVVAPAEPKPRITLTPSPSETTEEPSERPSRGDRPSPSPTPSPTPTTPTPGETPTGDDGGDGDDGDDCFLVFCN